MKRHKILLAAAGLMISTSLCALAGDIKVIANPSVKADVISPNELKKIFLEENTSLDDGTHVEPVLKKGGPVHETFLQAYLGGTDDDLQTHYRALVFTGKGSMPKELGSDAEVVAYVAKTRGAIGYVSRDASTEGVKTLAVANGADSGPRRLISQFDPEYPETLKRLGIGGTVRLHITIAPKGNVEKVEVLGGNPILAEAAISAVKHWIYSTSHSHSSAEITVPFDPLR